jgi:hypothetical protein
MEIAGQNALKAISRIPRSINVNYVHKSTAFLVFFRVKITVLAAINVLWDSFFIKINA